MRSLVLALICLAAVMGTSVNLDGMARAGRPIPLHIPTQIVDSNATFEIPYWLGAYYATVDVPSEWTLPSTIGNGGSTYPGEFLFIRNYGPADITLLSTSPETIEGDSTYVVPTGSIVELISGYPNWVVITLTASTQPTQWIHTFEGVIQETGDPTFTIEIGPNTYNAPPFNFCIGFDNCTNWSTVSLGAFAGQYNTGNRAINIGQAAGRYNIGYNVNNLGPAAGRNNTGIGVNNLGNSAGHENVGDYVNNIGIEAGRYNQGDYVLNIGFRAGMYNLEHHTTNIGYMTGQNNTGYSATNFGPFAGQYNSGGWVNNFGAHAGIDNNGYYSNNIGFEAGYGNLEDFANNIGFRAGRNSTGAYSNNIGHSAGLSNLGDWVNNLGYEAGANNAVRSTNNLGYQAGSNNIGEETNNIGRNAGTNNAGINTNNLNSWAGEWNSGAYVNNLGTEAGRYNSGSYVNNLGYQAGRNNTGSHCSHNGALAGTANTFSYCYSNGRNSVCTAANQFVFGSSTYPLQMRLPSDIGSYCTGAAYDTCLNRGRAGAFELPSGQDLYSTGFFCAGAGCTSAAPVAASTGLYDSNTRVVRSCTAGAGITCSVTDGVLTVSSTAPELQSLRDENAELRKMVNSHEVELAELRQLIKNMLN